MFNRIAIKSTIPDNEDKLSGAAVPSFSFVPKLPILGVGEEGTTKSIGVVIRTYKNQELTLPALVFSLAQAAKVAGASISFILLPTEKSDREFVMRTAEMFRRATPIRSVSAHIPADSSYNIEGPECPPLAKLNRKKILKGSDPRSLAYWICNPEDRHCHCWLNKQETSVQDSLYQKICSYKNAAHYHMTDEAVQQYLFAGSVTHLLVTNGDNLYHPNFFKDLIALDADVATCDFTHEMLYKEVVLEESHIDLGGTLYKADAIDEYASSNAGPFFTALGDFPSPRDYHDADFMLSNYIVQSGGSFEKTENILFYHQ